MTDATIQIINIIIQAVISLAIIATFLIYYFQLRTMKESSAAQNILSVVLYLQSADVRDARTHVRETLPEKPLADWSADDKKNASLVCSSYDIAAILIRKGLVEEGPFIENWGPSIKHCYEITDDYIREMQKPENSGPKYWNDFGWLNKKVG